jgi:hypothetical protein
MKKRGAQRVLVGTSEGKKPLGRPGGRWQDNVKMERDRWRELANAVMTPRNASNLGEFLDYLRLVRKESALYTPYDPYVVRKNNLTNTICTQDIIRQIYGMRKCLEII